MSPPSPTSTLFPYTTLFRSRRADRDKSAHFVLDQRGDFLVVVSFVDAARDEDDRLAEALERVPDGVYVGSLRVVDIPNTVSLTDELQPMRDPLERPHALTQRFVCTLEDAR